MGVKVATRVNAGGEVTASEDHPSASGIHISDGHLIVQSWSGTSWRTVAAYIPNEWARAERYE
jgi:hypothetical protein